MKSRFALALAFSLVTLGSASAQPPRVTMPKVLTLSRPEVQTELKLTDEQRAKVKEKLEGILKEGPNGAKYLAITPDVDLESLDADLDKLLDAKQLKRLKECWLQFLGPRAVLQPAVAKELAITPEQEKAFADLETEQREAMREHVVLDGSGPSAETLKKIKSMQEEYKAKFEKALTPEQKKKLTDLQGPKLQMKEQKTKGK